MKTEQQTTEEWFVELLRAGRDDPESLADELMLDITEQISLRLRELGMTSADLAKRIGLTRRTMQRLLDGQAATSIGLLVAVAHALGQRVAVQFYLAHNREDRMPAGADEAHVQAPAERIRRNG
jgi:transcriptional regulator with XRE-family HTH domain